MSTSEDRPPIRLKFKLGPRDSTNQPTSVTCVSESPNGKQNGGTIDLERLQGSPKNGMDDELEGDSASPSSRPSSRVSPRNNNSELISVVLPTEKKAKKRKHIKTKFDDSQLSEEALLAQQKERERRERLEKQKAQDQDHVKAMEEMLRQSASEWSERRAQDMWNGSDPFADIGLDEDEVHIEWETGVVGHDSSFAASDNSCQPGPSTSSGVSDVEVIQLSSDEEDAPNAKVAPTIPKYGHFNRPFSFSSRDDREAERVQHEIEKQRLRKRRNSGDLENTALTKEGRLLVNAGRPACDPDIFVAPHLTYTLQPHQLGGVRFMYDNVIETLETYQTTPGFGCILAHSMGLGKTIQVITFTEIFLRATKARKILIIVPINTIQNWVNEYERWLPKIGPSGETIRTFDVFCLNDTLKTFDTRTDLIQEWSTKGGVLLIGYEMFRTLIQATKPKKASRPVIKFLHGQPVEAKEEKPEARELWKSDKAKALKEALVDPGPDLVICDEGHRIKNLKTETAAALSNIRTRRRVVLTGYPLQNNLIEYYCMVDFVRPMFLGTKKSFASMFEKPIKNGQCLDSTPADVKLARQRTHVLVDMLKGFVQRRTHHLLREILPTSREWVLLLRKSPVQHALYRAFVIYAQSEMETGGQSIFNPLKAFAACCKIWNHPDILFTTLQQKHHDGKPDHRESHASLPNMMPVPINGQSFSFHNSIFPSPSAPNLFPSFLSHDGMRASTSQPFLPLPPSDLELGEDSVDSSKVTKGKKKTIASALQEELGLDSGLKYDWAEVAMRHYATGCIDNGYKVSVALSIVEETTKRDEKLLIFSQSLFTLNLLEHYLEKIVQLHLPTETDTWKRNKNYLRFDGSTSGTDREKLIKRFNTDPKIRLFLISTRAGSLGINLVAANRAIIFDASWNPCHDAQAVCRVYRYGQQRKTFIYRLILDNCMERAIFNRQISKNGLQQRVVDDQQIDANITRSELEKLLVYDESLDVVHSSWDTSQWEIDDEVLQLVVKQHADKFAEAPFLHESLMLEREGGLSEAEKQEAKLLFAREKMIEEHGGMLPDRGVHPGWPRFGMPVHASFGLRSFEPPPLRPTPFPMGLEVNQRPIPSRWGGGASIADSGLRDNVANTVFTEKEYTLPIVKPQGNPRELFTIPPHTRVVVVNTGRGVYFKLPNGLILDAISTPYRTYVETPVTSQRHPTSGSNKIVDVIELD